MSRPRKCYSAHAWTTEDSTPVFFLHHCFELLCGVIQLGLQVQVGHDVRAVGRRMDEGLQNVRAEMNLMKVFRLLTRCAEPTKTATHVHSETGVDNRFILVWAWLAELFFGRRS